MNTAMHSRLWRRKAKAVSPRGNSGKGNGGTELTLDLRTKRRAQPHQNLKKTPFGKLIVQGGVTTGLLNACVAEDLPGPGTVFLSTELKFLKAVGVGEELTARVEIESVRDDKPICKLKTTITDSAGDLCVDGTATTYTMALEGL